jgi:hypothetical protein
MPPKSDKPEPTRMPRRRCCGKQYRCVSRSKPLY